MLAGGGVGRIALRGQDAPTLRPINFALRGDMLIFRTGEGTVLAAAHRGESASFEIDDIDAMEHTGWSVIAVGKLAELSADDENRRLPLRSWASGEKDRFVGLFIGEVSGLRIPAGRGNR